MTLDVSSLYTNIPHNDGLDACRRFLTSDTYTRNQLPVECILSLIRLVLENNHFQFNNDNYLQKMGTAMGSPMAPAYASLFMGKLEQDFLKSRSLAPSIWLRFLDDIFMVWDHSIESLHSFIDALNSFHPSIKCTYYISTKTVNFLDVTVSKSENLEFVTNVYVSPQMFTNMLNTHLVTLNHAKMAFPIVKVKDIEELFLMTKNSKKVFFNCPIFFLREIILHLLSMRLWVMFLH